jgi:hypothetical protein
MNTQRSQSHRNLRAIQDTMDTIFTLETQMGKPTSNGCSVYFDNLWLQCFHGSLSSSSPWPKDPLRMKVKGNRESWGNGKAKGMTFHFPFLTLFSPIFFFFHLILCFSLILSYSLLHLLLAFIVYPNLHKLPNFTCRY